MNSLNNLLLDRLIRHSVTPLAEEVVQTEEALEMLWLQSMAMSQQQPLLFQPHWLLRHQTPLMTKTEVTRRMVNTD